MTEPHSPSTPLPALPEAEQTHIMDLQAVLGPSPSAMAGEPHNESTDNHPVDPPDRVAMLLELACDQQLQIASKLEEILELMSGPDEASMLDQLKELLAPLLADTATIKHQLGAA